MKKSLLYRLFGLGKFPAPDKTALENEGIILIDEGVKGTTTFRNFRAPGRYSNWKRRWHPSSIALTNARLLAFAYALKIIDVPLSDERLRRMQCSLENENSLLIAFDASLFHNDWSGTIEYRFHTPQAQAFLNQLRGLTV